MTKKLPTIPVRFLAVLKKEKKALSTFQALAASHQREYIDWITQGKRPETRERRMAKALEWISKGKPRNGK